MENGAVSSESSELNGKGIEEIEKMLEPTKAEETKEEANKEQEQPKTDETKVEKVEKVEPETYTLTKQEFLDLKRRIGRLDGIQHKLAKIEETVTKPKAETKNISPEDEAAMDALAKFFESKFGIRPENINQLIENDRRRAESEKIQETVKQIDSFAARAAELAGADWSNLEPIAIKLFEQNAEAADAGDEMARAWMREYLAHPAFIVLEARKVASKDVHIQAQKAAQEREKKASLIAPNGKASVSSSQVKKDMNWVNSLSGPDGIKALEEALAKGEIVA